ncbi:MAG: alpha/beta fold hydrolase [Gammaproteobacteria bacterium]|nr:alpha/beta fold hydrolase [Gammaproteobacteria bacterium]MXZ33295.1 alpha/beta fold hydrolase [Gammaproteobacteria bacterium]MYF01206.1 alpha/beta fold hydrolase [Gammaproteobacteria bacterium]MYG97750.1 alpha/beta fold hydrolase [Gammaproteobacteria bacterium]
MGPYPDSWLPEGVRSRFVESVNGLRMHVLEAGFEAGLQTGDRPALVMLHGFPELAYSWRNVMKPLADAGYHVIVPDLRGYGRTTGWSSDYDTDLAPFRMLNKVRDVIGLIYAYGYEHVACVIGHDFGSPLAGWCALTRPDIFRAVVMMSAPFGGVPTIPFDTIENPPAPPPDGPGIYENLANLPRPRKHYQRYYTTREANANMWHAEQGLSDFIRAYYHHKSADWEENRPYRLAARTAEEWAKMPTYYIMDLAEGMAETVAHHMPSPEQVAANAWLTEAELAVYAEEFGRTGFQGGLNSYRMGATGIGAAESQLYAGKTIDQPSMFISGASDWGTYQNPGSFERMQETVCTDMRAVHLVEGAGHWVQQEQAQETSRLLLEFLNEL